MHDATPSNVKCLQAEQDQELLEPTGVSDNNTATSTLTLTSRLIMMRSPESQQLLVS